MLRFILAILLMSLPALGSANCAGQNLLYQMPESKLNALRAQAAAVPYGEGLLWSAQKGTRQITLFGSFHLPHEFTEAHKERLLPLARAADVTYFEMNADDMQRFEQETRTRRDLMFIPPDQPTLPTLLTDDEWADLSAKLSARGFPPFLAAKMKPFMVSMMLGMSPCKMREMQTGAHGIDRALAEELRQKGLPSRSIEDYQTTAKLLDYFSPEKQIEMLKLSLTLEQSPDDLMETLYQAYIAEDVALIWEFNKMLSLDAGGPEAEEDYALFEKLLLTDRNISWIDVLLSAPEEQLLVVVGAAHLGGELGVLKLLENHGYAISRLEI